MLDLRLRLITFEMNGVWYSVRFRPAAFGRVKDVAISCSNKEYGFFYHCTAKIAPQNTTAAQALKMFWVEMVNDIKFRLPLLLRLRLSPK